MDHASQPYPAAIRSDQVESIERHESERSPAALARFLVGSPAAQIAARSLRAGAEVGVIFTDEVGEWRFCAEGAKPVLGPGKAKDPDFELRFAPGAVEAICAQPDADVGDLGVAFFEHIVARDPERKIRVTLRSGLVKLTLRGWLGVLARGGPKVIGWMAQKGLRGPGAVSSALARLKK